MDKSNVIGNGPGEPPVLASKAASGSAPTVAPSTPSPKITPLKGEDALSDSDVLLILENALARVRKRSGQQVGVSTNSAGIVMLTLPASIRFCTHCRHMRPAEWLGDHDICQQCRAETLKT